jgi:hypothetical protein
MRQLLSDIALILDNYDRGITFERARMGHSNASRLPLRNRSPLGPVENSADTLGDQGD